MDSPKHMTTDAAHRTPTSRSGVPPARATWRDSNKQVVAQHATAHRICLGSWELGERLGEGKWATVYAGRPGGCAEHWPWDYAIKVAHNDGDQARQLLIREAQVLRSVSHPHLVAMLSAQLDAASPWIVMPRLRGATLERALAHAGPFSAPHSLWVIRQTAEALAALHDAGWMHADVKPGNIHVGLDGHATLIDLGFALKLDSPECLPGGTLRGTLTYTAPEMISATAPVDGRSDIYGLGTALYELLTGKPPFSVPDAGELMLAHLQRCVPNPRRVLPGLHPEIRRLLQDMLAKDPLRRPDCRELVTRLVDLEIATLDERVA